MGHVYVAVLVLVLSATTSGATRSSEVVEHVANVEKSRLRGLSNAHSQEERELIVADLDFSADASRESVATAFARRFMADGKLIGSNAPVLVGPEAVRAALAGDHSIWTWAPEEARVSGDLGVTWGVAAISFYDTEGNQQSVQTRYVTVWHRSNGTWRIWLDIGNRGPAYQPPE